MPGEKLIVSNRKARYEYAIEDEIEAGIALTGTEVKSLRAGKANLQEAYCEFKSTNLYLRHLHIAPYEFGSHFNHDPLRPRQLLMHRAELDKWSKAVAQKGYTIVPLKLYFKEGKCKVRIGLGKGKKLHDKRQAIAERDTKRRMDRAASER
jgi:SsrA-binding protein